MNKEKIYLEQNNKEALIIEARSSKELARCVGELENSGVQIRNITLKGEQNKQIDCSPFN